MSPYVPRSALSACAGHRPSTGHVFRIERKRGPAWYAKYRLPDGRQVVMLNLLRFRGDLGRALRAWTRMHGTVSLELEGTFEVMGIDGALRFDAEIESLLTS
jgi:hypothetical protein